MSEPISTPKSDFEQARLKAWQSQNSGVKYLYHSKDVKELFDNAFEAGALFQWKDIFNSPLSKASTVAWDADYAIHPFARAQFDKLGGIMSKDNYVVWLMAFLKGVEHGTQVAKMSQAQEVLKSRFVESPKTILIVDEEEKTSQWYALVPIDKKVRQ